MEKRNDFVVILDWMVNDLALSGTRLIVYAIIYNFTKRGAGRFVGTVQYLMRWTGVSRKSIYRTLDYLTKRGLLERHEGEERREYVALVPDGIAGCVEMTQRECQNDTPSGQNDTSECQNDTPIYSYKKTNKKEEEIDNVDSAISEIVGYLNVKAGTQFRATTPKTQSLIRSLLKDGFTTEDMRRVIDVKAAEWLGDPRMNKYLRPSTLFNRTNFENYLNQQGGVSSGLRSKYE